MGPLYDGECHPFDVKKSDGCSSRAAEGLVAEQTVIHNRNRLFFTFVKQMTASAFDLRATDLSGPDRGVKRIARARQVAMYLLHTSLSMSFADIAKMFERDRTTVSHACKVIEELRDIPATDDKLIEMEKAIAIVLELAGKNLLDEHNDN